MTKESVEREIDRLVNKIVNQFDPEKVILFGSWAWGMPDEDSDVDFFIIKDSDKNSLEMMREVDRLLHDRSMPVDTLVYTPAQCERRIKSGDNLVNNILKSGKLLYERK